MFSPLEDHLMRETAPLSVVVFNALTGQCLYTKNENKVFKAASTIKVPIMMATMTLVDQGVLHLNDPLPVSPSDQVAYSLLNTFQEKNFSLSDLLLLMMSVSDNSATNRIIDRIGFTAVNTFLETTHATSTVLQRKMMDEQAPAHGLENHTTPLDMAKLMYQIYGGEGFTPESRQQMITYMSTGTCREAMDRYLPESLLIAHKIGELDQVNHDIGIVFLADRPYIAVLMGDSFTSTGSGREAIAKASQVIYECMKEQNQAVISNQQLPEFSEGLMQDKGAFIIKEACTTGYYQSAPYTLPGLKKILPAWNIETPGQSYAVIWGRVKAQDSWSEWLTWGTWGSRIRRGSSKSNKETTSAKIDVDTLIIDDPQGADGFQYKVELFNSPAGESPIFKTIGFSFDTGQSLEREDIPLTVHKVLPVPRISQMKQEPKMAKVMCSPTTLTMILQYYGVDIHPEEVALCVKDHDYGGPDSGYGNWVFNMAYLNSLGLDAKVQSLTLEDLKKQILQGHPVGISLSYSNDPQHLKYPYIENSPTSTGGHLIVLCGFETVDGIDYVVVNDPAGDDDQQVRRYYETSQFLQAWNRSDNTAYIITPSVEWIISNYDSQPPFVFERKRCTLELEGHTIKSIHCDNTSIELTEKDFYLWMSKPISSPYWQYNATSLLDAKNDSTDTGFYEWIGYSKDHYCYQATINLH